MSYIFVQNSFVNTFKEIGTQTNAYNNTKRRQQYTVALHLPRFITVLPLPRVLRHFYLVSKIKQIENLSRVTLRDVAIATIINKLFINVFDMRTMRCTVHFFGVYLHPLKNHFSSLTKPRHFAAYLLNTPRTNIMLFSLYMYLYPLRLIRGGRRPPIITI